jgi:hypothetical protein
MFLRTTADCIEREFSLLLSCDKATVRDGNDTGSRRPPGMHVREIRFTAEPYVVSAFVSLLVESAILPVFTLN